MIIISYSLVFQVLFLSLLCIVLYHLPRINLIVKISLLHLLYHFLSISFILLIVTLNLFLIISREPISLRFADFFSLHFVGAFLLLMLACAIYFRWVFRRAADSPSLTLHGRLNGNTEPLKQVVQQYLHQKGVKYKEVDLGDSVYYVLPQDEEKENPFLCIEKNKPKLGFFNAYDIYFKASAPWITHQDFEQIMKSIYQTVPRKILYYFLVAIGYLIAVMLISFLVFAEAFLLFNLDFFGVFSGIFSLLILVWVIKKDASDLAYDFFPQPFPYQSLKHQQFHLYSIRKQSFEHP